MNDSLAVICQSTLVVVTIVAYLFIALSRNGRGLGRFRDAMFSGWRPAAGLTAVYLLASAILTSIYLSTGGAPSKGPMDIVSGIMAAAYIFCLTSLGLGFSRGLPGFEPFHLGRGAKGASAKEAGQKSASQGSPRQAGILDLLYGALFLILISAVINMVLAPGLVSLGIKGPTQGASALEAFKDVSLVEVFLMFLVGAGIAEEVPYRLFAMSGLWRLLKKPSLAIVGSAVLFGLYHLTPLDDFYLEFWKYPLFQFITASSFGVAAGWSLKKWGIEATILGHTPSNFLGVALMKLTLR